MYVCYVCDLCIPHPTPHYEDQSISVDDQVCHFEGILNLSSWVPRSGCDLDWLDLPHSWHSNKCCRYFDCADFHTFLSHLFSYVQNERYLLN